MNGPTKTLAAKSRVNAPTLAANDIDTIKEVVKGKLYKQLLQQLMLSGCVSIESVRNPTNGSVTFTAKVEVIEPSKSHDEIYAEAA